MSGLSTSDLGKAGQSSDKPLVVIDVYPRRSKELFTPERELWLERNCRVVAAPEGEPFAAEKLDEFLPDAVAVIGQVPFGADRLRRAPKLKAIFNAGGNFRQNVDYQLCVDQRVHVLNCRPAFAQAVAEMSIGFAIDLGRGITEEDRRFRAGEERWQLEGNRAAVPLHGARVGVIGLGYLGKELLRLLGPFRCDLRVYDPWLPEAVIEEAGGKASGLDELLSESTFIFIMAGVTSDNEGFLDKARLARIGQGSLVILSSRAAVIDFDALLDLVGSGRVRAAIDVWPEEPVPADHRARSMDGLVLSPHRAGGIRMAMFEIGNMIVDDLALILQGLAPVRMQPAAWELVTRYRSR